MRGVVDIRRITGTLGTEEVLRPFSLAIEARHIALLYRVIAIEAFHL